MAATEPAPGADAPEDGIQALLDETSQLAEQVSPRVAAALGMAVEAFEEALLRLRSEPFAGHRDDA